MHHLTLLFLKGIRDRAVFHPICFSFDPKAFPEASFEEAENFLKSCDTSFLPSGSPELIGLEQIKKSALFLKDCFEHYLIIRSNPNKPFDKIKGFDYETHVQGLIRLITDPDFGSVAKQLLCSFYNLHGILLYNQNKFEEAKQKFILGKTYVKSETVEYKVLDYNLDMLKINYNYARAYTPFLNKDKGVSTLPLNIATPSAIICGESASFDSTPRW